MGSKACGKTVPIAKHGHLFRDNSVWEMSGVLVKEDRRVTSRDVLGEIENRMFRLYEFRGRFFVTRDDDDSVFYKYLGERGHQR